MKNYKTIREEQSFEIVEKKSRFIGYAAPVSSEKEALEFLNKIRKKHWDARHNVYAYSIADGNLSRCSDDGEPAKTAGAPILDIIEKNGLSNIIIVVTRYFGGILLGTGGLVKAYSGATLGVIEQSEIVVMKKAVEFVITVSYQNLSRFENEIERLDVVVLNKEFASDITIKCICKIEDYDNISIKFSELSNGSVEPIKINELFFGFSE